MKKLTLIVILALSIFLRVYRTSDLLGFWYDQGRDAITVWNLVHSGKFFLIGPTTGIEGIFLGPLFYYLITPAYILSSGNPAGPAIFLALLNVVGIFLIYKIGDKYFSSSVGLLGAFIYGFSNQFVSYNRWLSNPTPLPLFSLLIVYCLLKITHGSSDWKLISLIGLLLGLCLQFEAASAVFFIPAIFLIFLINFRHILTIPKKGLILGLFLFFTTLIPQLWFNYRHDNIIFNSFNRFLVSEKSFQAAPTNFLSERLQFYFVIFTNKFVNTHNLQVLWIISVIALFILTLRFFPKKPLQVVAIWFFVPVVSILFYHGNNGFVWDYYFTGSYPALVLLIAASMYYAFRNISIFRGFIVILLACFIYQNSVLHYYFFTQKHPGYVSLTTINQAVNWIYQDVGNEKFNTDIYVPPVIAYPYDYVFLWRGSTYFHKLPDKNITTRLYTVLEPDFEHPQLRAQWLNRQSTYSSLDKEVTINQLLVQRRIRFNK